LLLSDNLAIDTTASLPLIADSPLVVWGKAYMLAMAKKKEVRIIFERIFDLTHIYTKFCAVLMHGSE
jgi:hypothetical protein